MAVYDPNLLLSNADREALLLLGRLALGEPHTNNADSEIIPLSPAEAAHLLDLLERFSESRQFLEGSYLAEGLANRGGWTDDHIKEIYLSSRKRRGHSRIASGQTWREFVLRAGFDSSPNAWMWPSDVRRSPLRPMSDEHFLRMEQRLASAVGLHPRVQELIIRFVERSIPKIQEIREGKASVKNGAIVSFVRNFRHDLSQSARGFEEKPMSRHRIIALSTIIMDVSALFSTRDWTVTGVISSLGAVLPDAIDYPPD